LLREYSFMALRCASDMSSGSRETSQGRRPMRRAACSYQTGWKSMVVSFRTRVDRFCFRLNRLEEKSKLLMG